MIFVQKREFMFNGEVASDIDAPSGVLHAAIEPMIEIVQPKERIESTDFPQRLDPPQRARIDCRYLSVRDAGKVVTKSAGATVLENVWGDKDAMIDDLRNKSGNIRFT